MAEQRSLQLSRFPLVQPLPGAEALLKHLKTHNIPIALATSSTAANYALKSSNLQAFFDVFDGIRITGDDPRIVGKGKPQPDIFQHALQMINEARGTTILPNECLVFEDGIPGVQAGLSAGMHVIWVPDQEILALHEKEVDAILGDKGEMIMSLEALGLDKYGLPSMR